MIKLFPLLFLFSCSTSVVSIPKDAKVTSKTFSSPAEARNFVRNKWNYINILYEQSRDPYYGTPRWPEECLKRHEFGKISDHFGNTFFLSRLLLNDKDEPGDCNGKAADVAYLQCKDESSVREIICRPGECAHLLRGNPCPEKK